jgi:hypothetical protein
MKRMLMSIFGPRGGEVTGGRRKLHKADHIICAFANHNENDEVKEDEMGRAYSKNEDEAEIFYFQFL